MKGEPFGLERERKEGRKDGRKREDRREEDILLFAENKQINPKSE